MTVVPEKAAARLEHAGETYYFCSKGCAEQFSRGPEKFLAAPGTAEMNHGSLPLTDKATEHARATSSLAASDGSGIRSGIRLDAPAFLGQRGAVASGPAPFHAWRIPRPASDSNPSKRH